MSSYGSITVNLGNFHLFGHREPKAGSIKPQFLKNTLLEDIRREGGRHLLFLIVSIVVFRRHQGELAFALSLTFTTIRL